MVAVSVTLCCHAATYYVRGDGDDNDDGLSHATAWRTLDKINAFKFRAGDRVLFLEGNSWKGQLIVDWAGTADEPAVVGAYYLEDGRPLRGFRLARPIIDGGAVVPQQFDGLIRVKGVAHVQIEDLSVVNSAGRAIQFEDADDGVVVDCETTRSYKSGIKFIRSARAAILRNVVTRAGLAAPEDGGAWGGAIELVASDDARIANNQVSEVYGEGINVNDGSARAVIEGNRVVAAKAVGIYVDAAPDTTVRRNIVLGTSNAEFWRTSRSVGAGIALNNEAYHYMANGGDLPDTVQSRRTKVYGNLVADTSSGLGFWGQFDQSTFDGVMVFNNTFVDNETQLTLRDKPKTGSQLVNNILLSISPGMQDLDNTALRGMAAKSNYLSQGDPGGDFSNGGSFYQGLALRRMSGWRSITDANAIDWHDFEIAAGSPVVGVGDEEPRALSQGDDTYVLDFNGLPHNAAMDLGALHFSTTPIKTPKKPPRPRATP